MRSRASLFRGGDGRRWPGGDRVPSPNPPSSRAPAWSMRAGNSHAPTSPASNCSSRGRCPGGGPRADRPYASRLLQYCAYRRDITWAIWMRRRCAYWISPRGSVAHPTGIVLESGPVSGRLRRARDLYSPPGHGARRPRAATWREIGRAKRLRIRPVFGELLRATPNRWRRSAADADAEEDGGHFGRARSRAKTGRRAGDTAAVTEKMGISRGGARRPGVGWGEGAVGAGYAGALLRSDRRTGRCIAAR